MTCDEFRAELRRLGLTLASEKTALIEVWEVCPGVDFYLPQPETIDEADREETLELVKKTLGIGTSNPGVH